MKTRLRVLLSLLFVCSAPSLGSAQLVVSDFQTPGDGLLVHDTATGLQWLSPLATNTASYNQVVGGFDGLVTTEGFSVASDTQVLALFADNFDNPTATPSSANVPKVLDFFDVFGIALHGTCLGTTPPGACPRTQAWSLTAGGDLRALGMITIGDGALGYTVDWTATVASLGDSIDGQRGTWLVRPCPQSWYPDSDGDGYGSPGAPLVTCAPPAGFVTDNTDCNDGDPNIFPGAVDICGNGIDDDCDGVAAACPPANDVCAGATEIFEGANAVANDDPGTTESGVSPSGLPPHVDEITPDTECDFNQTMNFDSWYSFTPLANSGYTFSTCSTASYDSKLAIYSGACGSLVALACNDDGDGCAGFSSELNVTGLAEGSTYLVQVGGFDAFEQGTATMNVSRREGTQNFCTAVPNTVGIGAIMGSSGSTSILSDDFVLEATGLPNDFCIFFYGIDKANFTTPLVDGAQCVANGLRLAPIITVTGNAASRAVPQAELGNPSSGDTLFFQCFYRDFGNLGSAARVSDALAVTFGL